MKASRSRAMAVDPTSLSTLDLRDRLAGGALSAGEVAAAYLDVIAEKEPAIGAWAHLDPALVRSQAERLDGWRKSGRPVGPLHGLPVAVKDIVDTQAWPTENGTKADAGRRPRSDAVIVARLRAAGALVMGKTVTTELAFLTPAGTRNPHDPERTPGGSSSGSAAAVAAGMAPLAIGTQTNGSVIRPGAFCGVVAFKPSHGLIPRTGILQLSPELDTVGTFARDIEGAALLADALAGHDAGDPATAPTAPPRLLATARAQPPATPLFAFVKTPVWEAAQGTTREAFAELTAAMGSTVDEIDPGPLFAEAHPAHRTVMAATMARHLRPYLDRAAEALSPGMRDLLAEGAAISAVDFLAARDWQTVLNAGLDRIFDRYDAIITPAATGEAPTGLDTTGNPTFCSLWTFCGVPAISLPLMRGPAGMPLGVQLVGRKGEDGRLLRCAGHLWQSLTKDAAENEEGAT